MLCWFSETQEYVQFSFGQKMYFKNTFMSLTEFELEVELKCPNIDVYLKIDYFLVLVTLCVRSMSIYICVCVSVCAYLSHLYVCVSLDLCVCV